MNLNRLLIVGLSLLIGIWSNGQVAISDEGTVTVDCDAGGVLTDSNADAGNYAPGESYTITLCPDDGNIIQFNTGASGGTAFFDLVEGDFLFVYDGDAAAVIAGTAPVIGTFSFVDNEFGFSVQSTPDNGSGCMTLTFISAAGSPTAAGFEGTLVCATAGLPFDLEITSIPVDEDGYVDICVGETVEFLASTDYLNSGNGYDQSDATSTFTWSFGTAGFEEGFGLISTSYTFDDQVGYLVQVIVTDDFGYSQVAEIKVRVSTTPIFSGMISQYQDTICLGTQATIIGGISQDTTISFGVSPTEGSFQIEGSFETYLDLPDGGAVDPDNPEYYETIIPFGNFQAGSTLSDLNLIESICVTIHHTYPGDLEMWIVCPSSDTLLLMDGYYDQSSGIGLFPGGGLGADSDQLGNPPDLEGYEYCFTPTAVGTMEGTSVGGEYPGGEYEPMGMYTNLIGCPLNGDWTLMVGDYFGFDSGAISEWSITFIDSIVPDQEYYTPTLISYEWGPSESIVVENDTLIIVQPSEAGTDSYDFFVTDNFGCSYDTTITLEVLPPNTIDAISPGCNFLTEIEVDGSYQGGIWTAVGPSEDTPFPFFPPSLTGEMNVFEPGDYTLNFEDIFCQATQSVDVYFPPLPIALIAPDTAEICTGPGEGDMLTAAGQPFDLPVSYYWQVDSAGTIYPLGSGQEQFASIGGNYTVQIIDDICGNFAVGQAYVTEIPCVIQTYNVFSPNGDGVNDFFYIEAITEFNDPLVYVYNRWGKVVFERKNYTNNWDMDGLPEGTYYYVLLNPDNNESFKGYFTLVR